MAVTIGSTGSVYSASVSASVKIKSTEKEEAKAKADVAAAEAGETAKSEDTVELSGNYKVDIDALREQNEERIRQFTSKLMSMVTDQADKADPTISSVFGKWIEVTDEDRAEAQAAIEDGGEWSVNAVADRIMNMAYALSGGDESKLATLKSAVQEGFSQAGFDSADYSTMPEITGKTYDEIMKRFDEWEQTGMKTYDTNGKGTYTPAYAAEDAKGTKFDATV